jgi:hypothetical protein
MFIDKPNALSRRVKLENKLINYFTTNTSPTPKECLEMALELGVPDWARNGE